MSETPGPGSSSPMGATVSNGGANFSVISRHAMGMEFLLFDGEGDGRPSRVMPIDSVTHES
jgi:isoamylase